MTGTLIASAFTTIVVAIVCYSFGYHDAMKKAKNIPHPAFKKKFEKCIFGRVNENEVECFAPDYDGVPTIGLVRRTK